MGLVSNGGSTPFCGGTLIGPNHILTASHCINSNPTSNSFDVMVGEHSTTNSEDGTRHEICRAVRHPSYNSETQLNNDFAIVHLRVPVVLGDRAVPACLPSESLSGEFLAGKSLTVSGWGTLSSGGGQPTELHSVTVPGISNIACEASYGSSRITNNMLCAGDVTNGGIDSCQGDSGGKYRNMFRNDFRIRPSKHEFTLFITRAKISTCPSGPLTFNDQGRSTVVGVVSWGIGCATPGYPGVYGRVTEALDWINEELGKTC